ncbi:MAG: formate/nitrite transporter family protein [Treponema sp.]|nr:formate/nitrite transporter family protein [Treponema sp.]
MFNDEVTAVSNLARTKYNLLTSNPAGYIIASVLAGIYVGFGVLLAFTVGSFFTSYTFTKLLVGCTFGIALSLVIIAGAELFTGNNFVMATGAVRKTTALSGLLKVWVVSYSGNLLGSVLLALAFTGCGLAAGAAGEFISDAAAVKMSIPPLAIICRGILCNMLVCLAVWSSFRCKSEAAKLIIVFWCLLAFVTTGFEHSIANMTLLTISLISPVSNAAVSFGGWLYNISLVTLGNIIGGLIIAFSYLAISRKPV